MVKEIARTIEIPEGISVSFSQDVFTVRAPWELSKESSGTQGSRSTSEKAK